MNDNYIINLVNWVMESKGRAELTPHCSGVRLTLSVTDSKLYASREGSNIEWMINDSIKQITNPIYQLECLKNKVLESQRSLNIVDSEYVFRRRILTQDQLALSELENKLKVK